MLTKHIATRDPTKQQSRQKRRYLGVWDESTGEIITKEAERAVRSNFAMSFLKLLERMEIQSLPWR